ncbi:hypothetical protein JCM15765_27700 [Paradesulfitobacterium aromaticivorans]
MNNVPSDLYQPVMTVLIAIVSAALGIIGYFLKDIRSSVRGEIDENKREIEKVQEELADFKATLPHTYVMSDDFIRAVASLDHKVDGIGKEITEINKNIGKRLGGG